MSTPQVKRDQHLIKAARFADHIIHLLSQSKIDKEWVMVTAFYRALHLIEAGFIGHPAKVVPLLESHVARDKYIKSNDQIQRMIGRHYDKLKKASMIARYSFEDGCEEKYTLEDITYKLLRSLNVIEEWVERKTSQQGLVVDYASHIRISESE